MPMTYDAQDADEYWHDTDAEQLGNAHLYGVISGCEVTLDGTDMTYDVASGSILHNGNVVAVSAQANAGTLVSDAANPLWAIIYLDSSGTEGVVHGTAATIPSKPEVGDNVMIHAVKLAPGQTLASSALVSLPKRVRTHASSGTSGYKYKTATQTFTGTTTYVDVTATSGNMAFDVAASGIYHAKVWAYVSGQGVAGGEGIKFQFTGPAAPTFIRASGKILTYTTVAGGSDYTNTVHQAFTTSFSSNIVSQPALNTTVASGIANAPVEIDLFLVNGANAGTVTLQGAQSVASGDTNIEYAWLKFERLG